MAVKTYDPNGGTLTVGGNIITGFAPDTIVTIERNEAMWSLQVGADGEAARSKSNNRSGRFTFSLMQTADSNRILSGMAFIDETTGGMAVPVMYKHGDNIFIAETGWIIQFPSSEFAREAGPREWVVETDIIIMKLAGV